MSLAALPVTRRQRSILVVEDDPIVADSLSDVLGSSGYNVFQADSGSEARAALDRESPDLVVLDLMLPDVDGLVLCSSIKSSSDVPVIICSAMNGSRERVLGLKLGADDFVSKPFDVYELEARIGAVLRRHELSQRPIQAESEQPPTERATVGDLHVEPARGRATLRGQTLPLTPTEYRLLAALMERPNEILSRAELAALVWGDEDASAGRSVDVHIRRLRQKLSAGLAPAPSIVSQRGFGYGLMAEPNGRSTGAP